MNSSLWPLAGKNYGSSLSLNPFHEEHFPSLLVWTRNIISHLKTFPQMINKLFVLFCLFAELSFYLKHLSIWHQLYI